MSNNFQNKENFVENRYKIIKLAQLLGFMEKLYLKMTY